MIPDHLDAAFEGGRLVQTPGGAGRTVRRRLADLILTTGSLLLGYPGSPLVNEPSPVRPVVTPGRYPVWASVAWSGDGRPVGVAFVVVEFAPGVPRRWERAGSFFTDSGTGCLMDESAIGRLEQLRSDSTDRFAAFFALRMGVFGDGDCNLPLDPATGANAIVFKTFDGRYDCFVGRGDGGEPVCLVVDGVG